MKLQFSQTVRPGDVLAKRGDKYIRIGRRSRHIAGIYQGPQIQRLLVAESGLPMVIEIPAGVVYYGHASANVLWEEPTAHSQTPANAHRQARPARATRRASSGLV